MRAGLLHTVPALAEVFQRRVTELAPQLDLTHVADPSLLARAIATGVDEEVRERVLAHVRHLVATGAQAVMVTCSSIGEAAEASRSVEVPVLRVDEAVAERAVETAASGQGRVVVLATLESTLGPTGRLLRRRAEAWRGVSIAPVLVAGAAAARAAGDVAEHDRLVRAAVERAADGADGADAIVLAQASMAAAVDQSGPVGVPVLGSVDTGAERLVDTVTGVLSRKC